MYLVPIGELRESPEKFGFKKCKKPYNNCYYRCFARGCKMIFLSNCMIEIINWGDSDPRVHARANCAYKDMRTAENYLTELIVRGLVNNDYAIS